MLYIIRKKGKPFRPIQTHGLDKASQHRPDGCDARRAARNTALSIVKSLEAPFRLRTCAPRAFNCVSGSSSRSADGTPTRHTHKANYAVPIQQNKYQNAFAFHQRSLRNNTTTLPTQSPDAILLPRLLRLTRVEVKILRRIFARSLQNRARPRRMTA